MAAQGPGADEKHKSGGGGVFGVPLLSRCKTPQTHTCISLSVVASQRIEVFIS